MEKIVRKNGFGGCMKEWEEWKWVDSVGTHHLVEFSMLSYAMPIVSVVAFLGGKTQQLHEQWNNNHPYCSIYNFSSKLEGHSSKKKWKWKVQGVGSYTRNYMAQFHKRHINTNNFTDSFIKTRDNQNENQIEIKS